MSFNLPPYAKAIIAALVAGLAPVATDAATKPQGVTGTTGVASVIAALVGLVGTYWVPNGKSVKQSASDLVVTVRTDAGKFLTALMAGLPALVQSAAQAAIAPDAPAAPVEPSPEQPAVPAAPAEGPTVEPATLGKA